MKKFCIPALAVVVALTMAFFTSTVCAVANETNELSVNLSAPAVKMLSPVGGEHWKVGETHRVSWIPIEGKLVKLYIHNSNVYSNSSGSTNYIYASPVDAQVGYFDWVIDAKMLPSGLDLDGGKYIIFVDDGDGNSLATSNSFSITRK